MSRVDLGRPLRYLDRDGDRLLPLVSALSESSAGRKPASLRGVSGERWREVASGLPDRVPPEAGEWAPLSSSRGGTCGADLVPDASSGLAGPDRALAQETLRQLASRHGHASAVALSTGDRSESCRLVAIHNFCGRRVADGHQAQRFASTPMQAGGRQTWLSRPRAPNPLVQTRALPPPLPGPGIAEHISVASERAHLKECVRDDRQDCDDKCEHNDCEECVHCPSLRLSVNCHEWEGHRHQCPRGNRPPKLLIAASEDSAAEERTSDQTQSPWICTSRVVEGSQASPGSPSSGYPRGVGSARGPDGPWLPCQVFTRETRFRGPEKQAALIPQRGSAKTRMARTASPGTLRDTTEGRSRSNAKALSLDRCRRGDCCLDRRFVSRSRHVEAPRGGAGRRVQRLSGNTRRAKGQGQVRGHEHWEGPARVRGLEDEQARRQPAQGP